MMTITVTSLDDSAIKSYTNVNRLPILEWNTWLSGDKLYFHFLLLLFDYYHPKMVDIGVGGANKESAGVGG